MEIKKTNIEKMNNILHLSLQQIAKISILLNPIIPMATSKVLGALQIKNNKINVDFLDGGEIIPNSIEIKNLNILFKKIS